jgi:hypothetical protein
MVYQCRSQVILDLSGARALEESFKPVRFVEGVLGEKDAREFGAILVNVRIRKLVQKGIHCAPKSG